MTVKANDFNSYWSTLDTEVSDLNNDEVKATELPIRSNENSTAYELRFHGVGQYPLFAYLTVPKSEGPFPGLLQIPSYGSVVSVPAFERRAKYVILAFSHRGQRRSDQIFAAEYPGLLTNGLPDSSQYIWRYIVADCLRALDILKASTFVDVSKLAVVGNDLAAISAALRPEIGYLLLNGFIFRGASDAIRGLTEYPDQEFTDYIRLFPDRIEQVMDTISLFDPIGCASSIKTETLLTCSENKLTLVEKLANAIKSETEIRTNTGHGFLDHEYEESWLSKKLIS